MEDKRTSRYSAPLGVDSKEMELLLNKIGELKEGNTLKYIQPNGNSLGQNNKPVEYVGKYIRRSNEFVYILGYENGVFSPQIKVIHCNPKYLTRSRLSGDKGKELNKVYPKYMEDLKRMKSELARR